MAENEIIIMFSEIPRILREREGEGGIYANKPLEVLSS